MWPPHFRFWHREGRVAYSFAQIQFEPRDLWVGVFWRREKANGKTAGRDRYGRFGWTWTFHLYVCVIPMLPLHVSIMRTERPAV